MSDDKKLITVLCKNSTKNLLIRGVARKILASDYVSTIKVPSFSTLLNQIVQEKLNVLSNNEEQETKKVMLMVLIQKNIHEAFIKEARDSKKTNPQMLSDIINKTDFDNLNIERIEIKDQERVRASFRIESKIRTKLYKSMARHMLKNTQQIDYKNTLNYSQLINEVLADHYKIPLPKIDFIPNVDSEQMRITFLLENTLYEMLKNYCDDLCKKTGEYKSMNATLVDWIHEYASNEMW